MIVLLDSTYVGLEDLNGDYCNTGFNLLFIFHIIVHFGQLLAVGPLNSLTRIMKIKKRSLLEEPIGKCLNFLILQKRFTLTSTRHVKYSLDTSRASFNCTGRTALRVARIYKT